jgi:sterol desaturase/sphingolipid hydroxylase (fatty acid hydroxylase superfamily)
MRERLRPIVARLAFPSVLAGAVWAAHLLIERGNEPLTAFAPVILASFVVMFTLERLFPYQREWLRSHGDIRVDATYAVMIALLIEGIRPATYAVALVVAGWLSARSGGALWPGSWHWLVQLGLALVVAELPKYWFHRLEHEHDWLWRFHAPHHSVPRLYWLNASRFHPVDIGIDTVLGVGTLVALGCGDATIALFLVVSTVHGLFQHANLELRCGPLNWIFSMAELHRWHHSRTTAEANNNYGQNLIVWDVVFGSRYLPQDREPPRDIGLADLPNYPTGFLAQLAAPFRWRRIREQAAATPIAPLA